MDLQIASTIAVKLCYAGLFAVVLVVLPVLAERTPRSPRGRMMRAIRDNEFAAVVMGRNITGHYLEIFILNAAVMGLGGAMLTTLDGRFTPESYRHCGSW